MHGAPRARSRWALLVGINRYPWFAPRGQLRGCVNDVQVMRQILVESFDFPEDHITLLTDSLANREGILTAMRELVARVGEGDSVVFHYSGHGSQMTDLEGDEPDGLDETIVPYDSGRNPHRNRDITDDEIYHWLRALTAKTSAVTLILDCCHSGTAVRALPDEDAFAAAVRGVEADRRPPEKLPPSPIDLESYTCLDGGRDLGPSGWLPLGERYVLLAGCGRHERSFEIEEPAGVRHGALTFFLAKALRDARSGMTYRDLFEVIAPRVSARFPNQHPQLEGARDLEIFGVQRIEPVPFVPVLGRSGDRVLLGAGGACGLSRGSRWAVYAAGGRVIAPNEGPLGIMDLRAVRAVTSDGLLVHEVRPGAVSGGMRAVEQVHAVKSRLPVQVVVRPRRAQDVQDLLEGIGQSTLLRLARKGEVARARVDLVPVRSRGMKRSPFSALDAPNEETWAVLGRDGELLMPPYGRGEPGATGLLVENLEKVARFQLTLDLKNPGSALAGKIQADLFRWMDGALDRPEPGAGGEEIFYEGDRIVLTVVHQHSKPLFIYVLDLGLTGRIHSVYPVAGAEESLPPSRMLEVGKREGQEMCLYFPDEFPFLGFGGATSEGVETWKIFATTHPTDFYPLLQGGVREGVPAGQAGSLDDLLAITFGGGGYRDTRPVRGDTEDWIAIERSFRLRRSLAGRRAAR